MKAALPLLVALSLTACMNTHVITGAAPTKPADAFACMANGLTTRGYTVVTSEPAQGFLRAHKRDLSSPDSAEYSQVSISIYTDRDHETQFSITATRSLGSESTSTAPGLELSDAEIHAVDAVAAACGKK